MVRVKICGITNIEDALLASGLGAHALGFIFAESPRKVTPERAAAIITELPPYMTTVGVFVNQSVEDVKAIAKFCKLDALQLHGDESPEYCRQFEQKVIKAFRLQNYAEIEQWLAKVSRVDGQGEPKSGVSEMSAGSRLHESAAGNVAAFLVDAFVKGAYGGTGVRLDWEAVGRLDLQKPLILAGGLGPENVAAAIDAVRPYAIDVSSGVECEPGKKDSVKMRAFFAAIAKCSAIIG